MDFNTVAKTIGALSIPGNLIVLLLLIGLLLSETRYRRVGRWIGISLTPVLFALLVFPVGVWAMLPLENRFPRPPLPTQVDGILVLGGGEDPGVFASRGAQASIDAEGRLVEAAALSRHFPGARIVFTGIEAEVARAAFEKMGVPAGRVGFEGQARNTWENFALSKVMIGPRPGETWLLIARAVVMPRAMGVARQVGWDMLPWPVDYQTAGLVSGFSFNVGGNLGGLESAFHEWVGLLVYHLIGRTEALFPSPADPKGSGPSLAATPD